LTLCTSLIRRLMSARCWMGNLKRIAAALLFWWALPLPAQQMESPVWSRESEIGQPLFVVGGYNRLTDSGEPPRLDVAVEVMNDMLQFVRDDGGFTAGAELSLSISTDGKAQVFKQVKFLTQRVDRYELTNSRHEHLEGYFSAPLPPGNYHLKVVLEDQESRKRSIVEKRVTVDQVSDRASLALSDLMLAYSNESDPESRNPIHPAVSGAVDDRNRSFYCYFDLLRNDPMRVSSIYLTVYAASGEARGRDSLTLVGGDRLSAHFLPIDCTQLTFDRYDLEIEAACAGDTVRRRTSFRINYYGLPTSIKDMDQAIRQMRYICSEEEIRRLQTELPSAKEEAFIRFWNESFPTAGETINGKMVEYYHRIGYANDHFSNSREGWATDRGHVMALFGIPTEVERQVSDDRSVTYEIWFYGHLNRRFVFVDEYGFDDFRLATPVW